jgi:hypothetical protein
MDSIDKQPAKQSEPVRKAYTTPQLQVYGDVREVTQAAGTSTGANDGSGNPMHIQT